MAKIALLSKLSAFRIEGQIKSFQHKKKLKEFIITKPLLLFLIFIVIQLQLSAFSPHPSTPPQLNPPPSPLPLDFVHVSFIVVPVISSPHCPHPSPTGREKEGAYTLCNNMDGTGEHYAKWNKPDSKGQIPYDLTFNWNIINKRKKANKI